MWLVGLNSSAQNAIGNNFEVTFSKQWQNVWQNLKSRTTQPKGNSSGAKTACLLSGALCAAEALATATDAAMVPGTAGASSAALPAMVTETSRTCAAAAVSCAAAMAGPSVYMEDSSTDWTGAPGIAQDNGEASGRETGELVQPKSAQDMFIPRDENGKVVPLARDQYGVPVPLTDVEHTQIGGREGRKGDYRQTRQWDANGNEVKTTDWTDHGRAGHPNPHDHFVEPNATGGTPQRGDAVPSTVTMPKN